MVRIWPLFAVTLQVALAVAHAAQAWAWSSPVLWRDGLVPSQRWARRLPSMAASAGGAAARRAVDKALQKRRELVREDACRGLFLLDAHLQHIDRISVSLWQSCVCWRACMELPIIFMRVCIIIMCAHLFSLLICARISELKQGLSDNCKRDIRRRSGNHTKLFFSYACFVTGKRTLKTKAAGEDTSDTQF